MKIITILAAFLLSWLTPSFCSAQASFKVNPPVIDLNVGRSGTKVFDFELINTSSEETVHFRIFPMDFDMGRDGNSLFLEAGKGSRSSSAWLKVEPSEVTIEPGQTKKILARLSVPGVVTGGGYYSAIVCELVPKKKPAITTGSIISWRIATIVKTTVIGGQIGKKAVIDNFAMQTIFENDEKPNGVVFTSSLRNDSNIHIKAEGHLTILTPDRKRKGEVPLEIGTGTILPGHIRDFRGVYDKFLPAGDYIAKVTFRYGGTEALEKEIPFSIKTGESAGTSADGVMTVTSLKFTPEELKFKIPAGAFKIAGLTVQNQRNETVRLKLSVAKTSPVNAWLAIDPAELELAGGMGTKSLLRLTLPQDVKPGEYTATITAVPVAITADGKEEPLDPQTIGLTIEIPNN